MRGRKRDTASHTCSHRRKCGQSYSIAATTLSLVHSGCVAIMASACACTCADPSSSTMQTRGRESKGKHPTGLWLWAADDRVCARKQGGMLSISGAWLTCRGFFSQAATVDTCSLYAMPHCRLSPTTKPRFPRPAFCRKSFTARTRFARLCCKTGGFSCGALMHRISYWANKEGAASTAAKYVGASVTQLHTPAATTSRMAVLVDTLSPESLEASLARRRGGRRFLAVHEGPRPPLDRPQGILLLAWHPAGM